ncbi:F-box/FBD/LRR-repeat protein [Carex littledalei]|uniref:F-box/FBD/LRR-repeat protein n=1 Tax=Carex littledalei TaxID=544730 RepID=A0A833QN92_9POAL|nr:F-box/FBD/LRR-repeat protein [Carex littledalei]
MDGPQPQKICDDFNLNNDYISNLDADIKAKILEKLSLKEVVRTSILSSTWKDSWTSIPKLVFEEKFKESKLITALVDSVLVVHQGPLKKFKLVSKHACYEVIGRWMLVLSTNRIDHLNIVFNGDECKIPSRFFSCNALKFVSLSGCSINVPQSFNGFTLVHTLCLSNFNLSGFGIDKLVLSCPLLEHLELHYFFQQGCLCILAPNLNFLDIIGEFHDICLETPKLASGGISLSTDDADYREYSVAKDWKKSNITRALGLLLNIQKLQICGEFIGVSFEYA